MSETETQQRSVRASTDQGVAKRLLNVATWPPLVYLILGVFLILLWLGGTAAQIQTSEAWIMHSDVRGLPTLATYGQAWDFIRGRLPIVMLVPFMFAYGVQVALIVASIGVELPKHPKWRYVLSWVVVGLLICVNSAGDFVYSSSYGFWGQLGFTVVVLFITFVVGLLAIVCFIQAIHKFFA